MTTVLFVDILSLLFWAQYFVSLACMKDDVTNRQSILQPHLIHIDTFVLSENLCNSIMSMRFARAAFVAIEERSKVGTAVSQECQQDSTCNPPSTADKSSNNTNTSNNNVLVATEDGNSDTAILHS